MKFQFIVDNLNGQAPERRITSECHSAQWQIYSGPRESADLTLEESLSTSVSMGDVEGFWALEHETQSFGCLRKALRSLKCSNSEQNVSSAKISLEKQRKGRASPLSPLSPPTKKHLAKTVGTIQLQKWDWRLLKSFLSPSFLWHFLFFLPFVFSLPSISLNATSFSCTLSHLPLTHHLTWHQADFLCSFLNSGWNSFAGWVFNRSGLSPRPPWLIWPTLGRKMTNKHRGRWL